MDAKTLVQLTEQRILTLTYPELMSAMDNLEGAPKIRGLLMDAIHNRDSLEYYEKLGQAFELAIKHYHMTDIELHNGL